MGLLSALFVLLLAVTGLLLNHSDSLELDEARLTPAWLKVFYRFGSPGVRTFRLEDLWFSQLDGSLYRGAEPLADCEGALVGAVSYRRFRVLACEGEVLVLTADGEQMVERLRAVHGLSVPVRGLALCGAELCLRGKTEIQRLNLDALEWSVQPDTGDLAWSSPVVTPKALRRQLETAYLGQAVSWERLLLDLHSGRILGGWGVWLVDLMAVLFVFLAGSGLLVWTLGRRRRR